MKRAKIKKSAYLRQLLSKKHHVSRKSLLVCGFFLVIIAVAGTSAATYYFYGKSQKLEGEKQILVSSMSSLSSERDKLQAELAEKQQDLKISKENAAAKAKQIKELRQQVEKLNDEIKNLNNKIGSFSSVPSPSVNSQMKPISSSNIYDRIEVSQKFKPQIVRALDLIKANDGHTFSILNNHVEAIYEMSGCGGFQVKRPIYIGNCGFTDSDVMIAATIVHETKHVENVYVKQIYSINTKEQELPAYTAQYNFASKLSAPQWYLDGIQVQIDYYKSLPK